MRHAAPVRRELGTRTIFNVLGPLTNPAGARAGVFGVYSASLVRTIADALAQLETRRAFVVHGFGGIDELSPCGPNQVSEVVDGAVRDRVVDPAELGIEPSDPASLTGGSPEENAMRDPRGSSRARSTGRSARPCSLNAAGGIAAAGHAHDLREGLEIARATLDAGTAAARLEELAAFSQESS